MQISFAASWPCLLHVVNALQNTTPIEWAKAPYINPPVTSVARELIIWKCQNSLSAQEFSRTQLKYVPKNRGIRPGSTKLLCHLQYNRTCETIETPEKGQNFITELSEPLEALTERQRTVARQARLQPDPHRSSWSLNWHVWGSLCDEMMLSWNYADLKTFFLLVCMMILNTKAFIAQDGAKAE